MSPSLEGGEKSYTNLGHTSSSRRPVYRNCSCPSRSRTLTLLLRQAPGNSSGALLMVAAVEADGGNQLSLVCPVAPEHSGLYLSWSSSCFRFEGWKNSSKWSVIVPLILLLFWEFQVWSSNWLSLLQRDCSERLLQPSRLFAWPWLKLKPSPPT